MTVTKEIFQKLLEMIEESTETVKVAVPYNGYAWDESPGDKFTEDVIRIVNPDTLMQLLQQEIAK